MTTHLTAEVARELFVYDPATGLLTRKAATRNGFQSGELAGYEKKGYVCVGYKRREYKAHRVAWLLVTGAWPTGEIDHINGIRSDNRWSNIRDVSRVVNQQNREKARSDSISGLIGAHWSKRHGAFRARIVIAGRTKLLGSFTTAEAAHEAYVEAKRHMHEGCTL